MIYKRINVCATCDDKPVHWVGEDATRLRQLLGDEDSTIGAVKLGNFHGSLASVSPVDVARSPVHRQSVHLQHVCTS